MTYDCFSFFNELDLLEIRLNILDPYVDYFVLMESTQTFSGKDKPLYFWENRERFKTWLPKIIHVVPPTEKGSPVEPNSFERAFHQKEFLKVGLVHAKDEDTIYYGDLDEIWRRQTTEDQVLSLEQLNYCYYLNNRSSERWIGTVVGKWGIIKTQNLAHWRATHTNIVPDGGWHFTNMGGANQIRKKLEAYDHQEYNLPEIKSDLERRIKEGLDYVGRGGDWTGTRFSFWKDDSDLPKYICDNTFKYHDYFS